jgi:hypothetical protein
MSVAAGVESQGARSGAERERTSKHETGAMPSVPRDVDALLDLSPPALRALYESAPAPRIVDVSGDLKGRMLAITLLPPWAAALPARWARTGSFPWRGKSFSPLTEDAGEGRNRVVSDRVKLFRFTTRIAPSRHDGQPALELDYDLKGNPWVIRQIEDEIRELSPGLYLGQAYFRTRTGPRFVLWFGLQARSPQSS